MALIARFNITRFGCNNFARQLCKVKTTTHNVTQLALISQKAKRIHKRRLPPFDYLNKGYGVWAQLFDPMIDRCDENSKVIVVEGPIAAGKSNVAAKVAEEFDMIYLPPPNFDEHYITPYGYDIRTLDDRLPPNCQSCDVQKFLMNPHHPNVTMFQFHYLQFKYDQYITALLHVLSTGQGVVLERSFYSDYIFAKAMTNAGYMRPQALTFYLDILRLMKMEMMRPHLIIYLDIPTDAVKEKIKKRNVSYEVKSKVLTSKYLQDIENMYKLDFLKNIESHSHVLIYDWTNEGDVSTIVEDIEFLNFDYPKHDEKMADWTFSSIQDVRNKRLLYDGRDDLIRDYYRFEFKVPEMHYTPDEDALLDEVLLTVPGMKYRPGFNADVGDKNILWKGEPCEMFTLRPNGQDLKVIKEEMKKLKLNCSISQNAK
ncbi:hypothetical protein DMN91_005773 [Ooceraea biroi]|uniref:NADH dehydrogenase [ubiquinone] 1 alpha subcomplex subunit 10, mitochondrial n=1 Tax=Ooceraea biroi TaxID=2015173 RepID=A0A3L8DLU4_OOCBI|nr:NADH dehydrogenase [ubiquinone] 1 alpha subcomplex subunit 10, mitochondrial [Ooceraea biroi]RLU21400.1 hypothetical protein DMN91_005773 [Ooceraea biroi]